MNLYRRMKSEYGNVWGLTTVAIGAYLLLLSLGFSLSYTVILAQVNYIILLIYIIVLIILSYCSDIVVNMLVAAGLSGIVQEPQTIRNELKMFFSEHFRIMAWVVLFSSLPFVFLANVPIFGHGLIFWGLISLLILMGLTIFIWDIKGNWVKNIIFYSLLFLIIITPLGLIPNDVYKKTIGFSPFSFFHRSETEKTLQALEDLIEQSTDAAQTKTLEDIMNTVRNKDPLSPKQLNDFGEIQKKVADKSLPTNAKKAGESILEKAKDGLAVITKYKEEKAEKEKLETELKELRFQLEKQEAEKKDAEAKKRFLATPSVTARILNSGGGDTKRLLAGKYRLSKTETLVGTKNTPQLDSNGKLTVLTDNELVFFTLPPGRTGDIEITPTD